MELNASYQPAKFTNVKKNVSDKFLGLDRWATITLSEI